MAVDIVREIATGVQPPAVVLVTGANGFIASHVVSQLLDAGYQVLGTVRSSEKAQEVLKVHDSHQNLNAIVVDNITDKTEYIDAINAASLAPPKAIIHLAAPFSYAVTNYESDLLRPAIKGTEAILDLAEHYQVKTVVHTNSFACIYDAAAGPAPGKTYTASDWSPLTYEDGVKAANAPTAYRAAKAVAEMTAWEYMRGAQNQPAFNLISLCPAMVFGAFLPGAESSSIAKLNESNKLVWDVARQGRDGCIPPTKAPVWIDVRDVAKAHVKALTMSEKLAGKRLLLAAGVYCNQEIADAARRACPAFREVIPVGETGKREADTHFKVDADSASKMLGIEWTSLENSLKSLVPQLFGIASREED
ncbi:hypothetical protein PRZ48_012691 [Zasmidium cellare]|uniref:NAD-dependent epimerase/dehydratase domain-containing protein n=1 Tax=Zasmidium cellare TaxID=395010 RepID=A0ABR0E6I6_ZASCE|nr:hypothetical protein PRZ48_012691 [Zasmidium cellare]